VAFEFTPPAEGVNKIDSLIFVGGLTDGFCTVPYVSKLAQALANTEWSVFSVLLSSSYGGWGVGSLDRDVEELGQCVRFIRDLKASRQPGAPTKGGKIVLMGHSTGSQDVLHYLYSPNPVPKKEFDLGLNHIVRPELDGAILQAPVSDREGLQAIIDSSDQPDEIKKVYGQLVEFAKKEPYTEDKNDAILPMNLTAKLSYPPDTPLSARRFLSLVSPESPKNPSDDDLFSSDLNDERLQETFGMIGTRGMVESKILFLYSGKDEYCPHWVDKLKLLQRWQQAIEAGGAKWDGENSGVITGASHNVKDEGQQDLIDRVLRYLHNL
jgi:pimeloyl-ACP methyl ester carboxylesterase